MRLVSRDRSTYEYDIAKPIAVHRDAATGKDIRANGMTNKRKGRRHKTFVVFKLED